MGSGRRGGIPIITCPGRSPAVCRPETSELRQEPPPVNQNAGRSLAATSPPVGVVFRLRFFGYRLPADIFRAGRCGRPGLSGFNPGCNSIRDVIDASIGWDHPPVMTRPVERSLAPSGRLSGTGDGQGNRRWTDALEMPLNPLPLSNRGAVPQSGVPEQCRPAGC